jgi:hypothetical protein
MQMPALSERQRVEWAGEITLEYSLCSATVRL